MLLTAIWVCILFQFIASGDAFNSQMSYYETEQNISQLFFHAELFQNINQLNIYSPIWEVKLRESVPLFTETQIQEAMDKEWVEENMAASNYQTQCSRDLTRVLRSIPQKWALLMLDSDGKLPSGLLYGNVFWNGEYRECLAVEAPPDPGINSSYAGFGGKYCRVTWNITALKQVITTGLCVPDTCEESDLRNWTNFKHTLVGRNLLKTSSFPIESIMGLVSVSDITCQSKTTEYDAAAIVVLVVLYIFVFLVAAGTALTAIETIFPLFVPTVLVENISSNNENTSESTNNTVKDYDDWEPTEEKIIVSEKNFLSKEKQRIVIGRIEKFLKCFCLIKNGAKIFDTSDRGGTELRCIHGIRFISMAWIILGHTYSLVESSNVVGNIYDVLNLINNFAFQIVTQADYAVDAFFLLSGFLLTHIFLKKMSAGQGKISWLAFYLHRYWRLTPVYAMVLGFDTAVSWYLFYGPSRLTMEIYRYGCSRSWWYNLLYINNFAPTGEKCIPWAWYLANDMQFYIISPVFLYPLWRWPKIGLSIIAVLFCTSCVTTFVISYKYDLLPLFTTIPTMEHFTEIIQKTTNYLDNLYIYPYTCIGPYLVGVFLAYLMYVTKGKKKFLPIAIQVAFWAVTVGLAIFITVGTYNFEFSRIGASFYNAINRSLFAICLAWVIFSCLTGHCDVINNLLSSTAFIPLSRLTYCAYLMHPVVMTIYIASLPQPIIMTHFQMVLLFFGFMVISYIVAVIASLLFESPAMGIEKLLW